MHKGADAYRSIGEAAKLVGVAAHVLRYWEGQFPQLKPVRRPDGRRYYRPDDVRLAAGLAAALREDGLTTRGAARLIAQDGGASLRARGAARLPEAFALTDGEPAPEPPPKPARAPRATAPRKPAAKDLPLFPDLPPDSPPLPAPAPLARLARLTARLHDAQPPAPARMQQALAHLRAHLAPPA